MKRQNALNKQNIQKGQDARDKAQQKLMRLEQNRMAHQLKWEEKKKKIEDKLRKKEQNAEEMKMQKKESVQIKKEAHDKKRLERSM